MKQIYIMKFLNDLIKQNKSLKIESKYSLEFPKYYKTINKSFRIVYQKKINKNQNIQQN